jgi:hypothetical protein
MIIIDEVHNLLNTTYKPTGLAKVMESHTLPDKLKGTYTLLFRYMTLNAHASCKMLFMTATPIFDNLSQLYELAKAINPKTNVTAKSKLADIINAVRGKVSYFPGTSANAYPMVEYENHDIELSKVQDEETNNVIFKGRVAKDEDEDVDDDLDVEVFDTTKESFLLKQRQISLVCLPKNTSVSLSQKNMKKVLSNLPEYAPKINVLLENLKAPGKHVVFSNFVASGLEVIRQTLNNAGWVEFGKEKQRGGARKAEEKPIVTKKTTKTKKDAVTDEKKLKKSVKVVEEKKKSKQVVAVVEEKKKSKKSDKVVEEKKKSKKSDKVVEEKKKSKKSDKVVEEKKKSKKSDKVVEEKKKSKKSDKVVAVVEEKKKSKKSDKVVEEKKKSKKVVAVVEEKKKSKKVVAVVEEKKKSKKVVAVVEEKKKSKKVVAVVEEKKPSKVKVNKLVYVLWDGSMKDNDKSHVKNVVNSKENIDGSLIKVILGSPSIKEGVSFKHIQHMHMMDPVWNQSSKLQVEGRAIRFCSHSDIQPKHKELQRKVIVHIYKSVPRADGLVANTCDKVIYDRIIPEKQKLVSLGENALQKVAIDYFLFKRMYRDSPFNSPKLPSSSINELSPIHDIPDVYIRKKQGSDATAKSSCPKPRRPNADGNCKEGYMPKPNKEGDLCCYRATKSSIKPVKEQKEKLQKLKTTCPKGRDTNAEGNCPEGYYPKANKAGVNCCIKKREKKQVLVPALI